MVADKARNLVTARDGKTQMKSLLPANAEAQSDAPPFLSHNREAAIKVTDETFVWRYGVDEFKIACQRLGTGLPVLCLPAMSTVSTRTEWEKVAGRLARGFEVTLVDWPGFGASSRPRAPYGPQLCSTFLRDFVQRQFSTPVAVLAAGHAAGYVLHFAVGGGALWSRAVLVAPT